MIIAVESSFVKHKTRDRQKEFFREKIIIFKKVNKCHFAKNYEEKSVIHLPSLSTIHHHVFLYRKKSQHGDDDDEMMIIMIQKL